MNDKAIREQLITLLRGGEAHGEVEKAVRGFPPSAAGSRVAGIIHTPWRLLEHMRIAQWDILEFSRNPSHVSPDFPDGYWPADNSPPDAGAWNAAVSAFCADLVSMQELVQNPATDLYTPIPHGDGQTIFREALLVADHNSYHLGQLWVLRRGLGA